MVEALLVKMKRAHASGFRGIQQVARPIDIDAPKGIAIIIFPIIGFGGDMEYDIAIGAGVLQQRDIGEIAGDGFEVEPGQDAEFLLRTVEGADAVASRYQQARQMRADEAGGAGD